MPDAPHAAALATDLALPPADAAKLQTFERARGASGAALPMALVLQRRPRPVPVGSTRAG